jgi:hypothetical protein
MPAFAGMTGRVARVSCVEFAPLPVDAAHAEVFDLEELLDAVFRAFTADAAFLYAAEGAISVEMMPSLIPTILYSSASATRQMRPMSRL